MVTSTPGECLGHDQLDHNLGHDQRYGDLINNHRNHDYCDN